MEAHRRRVSEPRTIRVGLGERSYDVTVGDGVLDRLGAVTTAAVGGEPRRAMLVIDEGVGDEDVARAGGSLGAGGYELARASFDPTEQGKSLATLAWLLDAMAAARLERGDPVVALGGGIVGDVAGFAAASYRRGVPLVQCPTTLLAMVDASVGGKTAVNLFPGGGLLKNMAGAFWQPRAVLGDVRVLATLDDRDYRGGLGECVKHGLLAGGFGDPGLLDDLEGSGGAVLGREAGALVDLIARNVAMKARVVESDEREEAGEGGRALLNLGHTFAHALEAMEGLSPDGDPAHAPLRHGEAVALGLVAACETAVRLGRIDGSLRDRVEALLTRFGLPTRVALENLAGVVARMGDDKKTAGGRLRFVLPAGGGRCTVERGVDEAAVLAGLARLAS